MKPAAWRLAVAAVLFLAWVGYLAYLAFFTLNPVVLSRPQFLVAEIHVLATRQADDSFVVDDVLWPADRKEEWQGKKIVVVNLKDCQTWSAADHWHYAPPPEGSRVLMPLTAAAKGAGSDDGARFEVCPIPASPGFPPPESRRTGAGPPRIYPDSPAVLSQYRSIPKP